jgi:hypothetical protein
MFGNSKLHLQVLRGQGPRGNRLHFADFNIEYLGEYETFFIKFS